LAIVVPAWTLALAFVAGLAVGVVGCRLAMGRGRTTAALPPAESTEPEPVAPPAASTEPEPVAPPAASTEPEPTAPPTPPEPVAEAATEAPAEAPAEDRAAAVDDVVAELERRVKGRRTDGEADRTTGGRRGRGE
jgi:outer membrane biosynthesis protein TonB